ncbi:chemotaxis protein CheA [Actomonas aquatica]|uniref:histidine kinase n=1 Tax=Actomonas aquatica TaxID=2866162 RepID=A0ABZ1CCN9_9BACT|nr:chemotaxis protein CheA [Opitutus sp. WL0086]WRQ89426.1 chemotaxis protein CheA [Opitutus sp. WL0086]
MSNDLQEQFVRDMLTESYEGLDRYDQAILAIEQGEADNDTLNDIFRVVHTLKGTAGCLGFHHIEKISHTGENLLSLLRDGALEPSAAIADGLLKLSDALRAMLGAIETTGTDDSGEDYTPLSDRLTRLKDPDTAAPPAPVAAPAAPATATETAADANAGWGLFEDEPAEAQEAINAAAEDDANAANQGWGLFEDEAPAPAAAETDPTDEAAAAQGWGLFEDESESAPEVTTDPAQEARENAQGWGIFPENAPQAAAAGQAPASTAKPIAKAAPKTAAPVTANASVRVDVGLLDKLMNMVGELVLSRNQLLQLAQNRTISQNEITAVSQRLNQVTTELQEGVMKTRMQPIGNVWGKFPRIVRDIAADLGKNVRLETIGADTELDRTIIEAIKDPLTHIVRNSVDHGVEMPDVRVAAGKSAEAHVIMRAFHEGGQVNIEIIDDGAGINGEKVRRKALEKGLISEDDAARLSEREMVNLIFLPGFSTAEKITNVSGRGVGMDVVKTNIEKIGGSVDIHSVAGQGTTLKIKIPLTLAIVPALVVRTAGQRFAIPQVSLVELVHVDGEEAATAIEQVYESPVFRLRGDLLPLVFLDEQLKLRAEDAAARGALNIIVLRADQQLFGLVVDEVSDSEEIVVKPLGQHLKGLPMFAGATIMGDGTVALILDALGLAQHAGALGNNHREIKSVVEASEKDTSSDITPLLLFSVPGRARVALPLAAAARLEEFQRSDIETAGGRESVQYRDGIMPLVRIERILGTMGGGADNRLSEQVIVFQSEDRSVGLVVGEIRDIVEERFTLQPGTATTGVAGSAIIQGQITDLVDVPTILQATGLRGSRHAA